MGVISERVGFPPVLAAQFSLPWWKHRWQNINYQYLGGRKGDLAPRHAREPVKGGARRGRDLGGAGLEAGPGGVKGGEG